VGSFIRPTINVSAPEAAHLLEGLVSVNLYQMGQAVGPSMGAGARGAFPILNGIQNGTVRYERLDPTEEWKTWSQLTGELRRFGRATGDCFPEGTVLLDDSYSFVPIDKVRVGQRIWGKDRWSIIERVWEKGSLSLSRVHMNNGSAVELTEDHKVYVWSCETHGPTCRSVIHGRGSKRCVREWIRIRVSELQPRMVLLTPDRISFGHGHRGSDLSWLDGVFVADGWTEDYRFAISGKDGHPKELQKREVARICSEHGWSFSWHKRFIRINEPSLVPHFGSMGRRAPEKKVLSLDLCEEDAGALLRGVLADSGTNKKGTTTFRSTSRMLAMQFRVLQKMHGRTCGSAFIEEHGGLGENPVWDMMVRRTGKKALRVKSVERGVRTAPCFDIQTDDHYVYLPEADVTVSNCEDFSSAVAAELRFAGIPASTYVYKSGPSLYHVVVKTDKWGLLDPSRSAGMSP
jgi:hypothetical protein